MKIKFLPPSPKAGTIEHIENQTGRTLIAAGLAEAIPYKDFRERLRDETPQAFAPVTATVTWTITQGSRSGAFGITAKCSNSNCSTFCFDQHPDTMRGKLYALEHLEFVHSCGGSVPETVPKEICERYRKLFKVPKDLGRDMGQYYRLAAPQPSLPVDLYKPQIKNGVVVALPIVHPPQGGQYFPGSEADESANFLPTPLLVPNPLKGKP
jgi:hypothetical protein